MAMMIETGHLFPSPSPSITALPQDSHPHPQQFLSSSSSSSQYESVMIGGGSGGVSIPAVLPPRGVAGPSQWWLQSAPGRSASGRAERYPFAGQSRVLAQAEARYAYAYADDVDAGQPAPRRRGRHMPVFAEQSVINDNGAFNGSCVSTELQSSPLHTIEGTCASYYPDITAYCCSGIGGNLTTIPWGIQGEESIAAAASSASASGSAASSSSTTTSAASSSATAADEEPLCQTTDYNDALACFKLTAETNCKNGQSGLYGLCNSMGTDTSTVTAASSTSGSASLISAASTSGGVAVERGPPWKRQWIRGVVAVATAVVLVVGV